jgi:septum site-determining protein MinD
MARKIVVTSGKGGVGKTTICANLGCFLARQNKRVALFDLDIGLNNLDVVMGVENKIVYDILDVAQGKCRPKQALIQDANCPNLYIMPSAHNFNAGNLSSNDLKNIIDSIDGYFDFILLDCPAGIDEGFHRALSCAEEALVVVTPHLSSLRDADKVISIITSYNINTINVIVNRARGDLILDKEMISVEDIMEVLNTKLIGVIPEDDYISTYAFLNSSVFIKSNASRAFYLLADNLISGTRKIYDCTLNFRGFLGGIKRILKRKLV